MCALYLVLCNSNIQRVMYKGNNANFEMEGHELLLTKLAEKTTSPSRIAWKGCQTVVEQLYAF